MEHVGPQGKAGSAIKGGLPFDAIIGGNNVNEFVHKLVDNAKWLVKDAVLGVELPRRYERVAKKRPVDPKKVLFVNGKLETVPDAFHIIMPYLEERYGMDVQFVGLGQQVCGNVAYHERCKRFVDELASAAYVFLEDASDVVSCVPLRPETKVVQLWHACGAFKKWGMSTAELKFGNTGKNIQRHPFYGNLSLVTVSSPEVAWAYREAMMLEDTPDVVQALGVSRTDAYFDEGFTEASREWLAERFPGIQGRKVILYAPTFRGATKQAKGPDELDISAMREALGQEYALVIKHHPFVKDLPPIPQDCQDFAFMAHADDPTDSLLICADVMVTDYSSVVFEYSLLGRPMAFFAYDLDDYNDWRGFYYDYDEMTPGPVVRTTGQLIEYLDGLRQGFDSTQVDAFRRRFMSACDGRATQRICEATLGR